MFLNSNKIARVLMLVAAILVVVAPFALAAGERGVPLQVRAHAAGEVEIPELVVEPTEAPIAGPTSIVVTSVDPAGLTGDAQWDVEASAKGPFNGHATLNLYVITMFDSAEVGEEAFDQLTRFILPDGSVYEARVTPVDPDSRPGDTIKRMDLASHPVRLVQPSPARQISSILPSSEKSAALQEQVFTSEILPVSGTWITKHNLYGTWVVEVSLVRDGEVITSTQATFDIGIDF